MIFALYAESEVQQLVTLLVYFLAIREIIKDAKYNNLPIKKKTMYVQLGVGALIILCYSIDTAAKCLIFFNNDTYER